LAEKARSWQGQARRCGDPHAMGSAVAS
jgi:hypothetical protein